MPLESLRQPFDPEQAGHKLREVQIEHEAQPESTAKQKYEALKNSELFNTENQAWNLGEEKAIQQAYDQLYDILTLAEFDKDLAQKKFAELKTTDFYKDETWCGHRGNLVTKDKHAIIPGIAVEALFDAEKGRKLYENFLKEARDRGDGNLLPTNPTESKALTFAATEMENVYVLSLLNPQEARRRYEELKRTPLWDEQEGMWLGHWSYDNRADEEKRFRPFEQLLSMLIELQLGIPGTKEAYERIKKSPLFDPELQLWNSSVSAGVPRQLKYTTPQLLSVMVEARLEKLAQQKLVASTKPPEERNF